MKEYPIDYLGPKAGKSDDAEWLAVTEYQAFRHIINADWSYSDFDCWLGARDTKHVKIGEKIFIQALQEFQKINKN